MDELVIDTCFCAAFADVTDINRDIPSFAYHHMDLNCGRWDVLFCLKRYASNGMLPFHSL